MSRTSNDLKNAFKSLQVHRPLKLPNNGAGLKAPSSEVVRKEAPQIGVPLPEGTKNEEPHSEVPQKEVTQIKATHIEIPQNDIPHSENAKQAPPPPTNPKQRVAKIEAPQNEHTQKESAQNVVPKIGQPKIESPQNKPAPIEAPRAIELPQKEAASQGFFKLAHSVFAEPIIQRLSGDCFRLFLWLSSRAWRFPSSDGSVRASVSFIEKGTGMSHASISRGLKTLKAAGLVETIETDFKKGNLWQVSRLAMVTRLADLQPDFEAAQIEVPQNEKATTSKRETSSLKLREELPQNEEEIRINKNLKNNSEEGRSKIWIEMAVQAFASKLSEVAQKQMVDVIIERNSNKSFTVPEHAARILAACEWFKTQETI